MSLKGQKGEIIEKSVIRTRGIFLAWESGSGEYSGFLDGFGFEQKVLVDIKR
jgi:hypothetical protein